MKKNAIETCDGAQEVRTRVIRSGLGETAVDHGGSVAGPPGWKRHPRTPGGTLRNPLTVIGRTLAGRPVFMRAAPAVLVLDRAVRRISRGRKGILDLAGLPSLELIVVGRRSGLARTVSLLYVPDYQDRNRFLLVGSNWGRARHPQWSANLSATVRAELHSGGERFAVTVRMLRGREREWAWQRAVDYWPGYVMEQRLAGERVFRLFELLRI